MTSYEILRYPTISFGMLLTGISVGSPLSIWDNLRYPQDKVCYSGIEIRKQLSSFHITKDQQLSREKLILKN